MSLEQHFQGRMNIRDLNDQHEEREDLFDKSFDLESMMPRKRWDEVEKKAKNLRNHFEKYSGVVQLTKFLTDIKILNPDYPVDKNDIDEISNFSTTFPAVTLSQAKAMRCISPEVNQKEMIDRIYKDERSGTKGFEIWLDKMKKIYQEDCGKVDSYDDFNRSVNLSINMLERISNLKIAIPDQDFPIDDRFWKKYDYLLRKLRNSGEWGKALTLSAYMKIVNPDFSFKFSKKEWEQIKAEAESCSGHMDISDFVSKLSLFKILSAKEIKIDQSGLELIPDDYKREERSEPLPVKRKF